jgi:hemerythrin-like domain-containing protein
MDTSDHSMCIRQEHDQIHELEVQLLECVSVIPRMGLDRWLVKVRTCYDQYRSHLVRHIELEEEGGYMADVTDERPALTPEVDRLVHEHFEMNHLMKDIHRQLTAVSTTDRLIIRDLCRRIQALLQYVDHHEREENLVVTSVLTDDLGTED